ncbi:MAG: VanZ family protein [Lachnospiraceae bacterium]|nr:VanZ family protein [Lachnospiraceae bacterium]
MSENQKRKLLMIIFLMYLAILLRITVFRSSFRLGQIFQNGKINFTLFESYILLLQQGRWFIFFYLFVGNVIWFVPFGVFCYGVEKRQRIGKTLIWGFLFSLGIESMQFLWGTGVSELDDLVLNTLGAWIGAAGVHFLKIKKKAEMTT